MPLNLDKKTKEIISRVSNRNSIEAEKTEEIIEHFFSEMKKEMRSDRLPTILIHNFGRFSLKEVAILKTAEALNDENLLKIAERVKKEKHIRK